MNDARAKGLGRAVVAIACAFVSACATSSAQVATGPAITRTVGSDLQWGPCPPIFPAGCQIAVLHGDPARPNADVFLRVPGGGGGGGGGWRRDDRERARSRSPRERY